MTDPLSEIIALLQPRTVFSKRISGAGRWGVRYSEFGQPSFCAVLEGSCRLAVDGQRALTLEAGDFVLLPATPGFTLSGPVLIPGTGFNKDRDKAFFFFGYEWQRQTIAPDPIFDVWVEGLASQIA